MERGTPLSEALRELLESVQAEIPDALLAADKSSYCSEERVRAIGFAAAQELQATGLDTTEGEVVKSWSSALAENILTSRERHVA